MAVKTYFHTENEVLSKHFVSNEFASTCGSKLYSKKILVDNGLIKKLEKFFSYGITAIVITSGYRTSSHDIAVGGNGRGAHTIGIAADIIGYVKDTKVPSNYMACFAELIGFSGIGIIDSNAIHVDVRTTKNYTNGHWFGNEQTGENYIVSFFKYFNLSKSKVKNKYKKAEAVTWTPKVGDKVIVNGTVYGNGDGSGGSVKFSKKTMYVVNVVNKKTFKYYIGVAKKKSAARQGWGDTNTIKKKN